MLAQLPTANAISAQFEESETEWERLGEAPPAPHVVVLLSPDQVPPALRELIAASPASLFPGLNLPNGLQPPPAPTPGGGGGGGGGGGNHAHPDHQHTHGATPFGGGAGEFGSHLHLSSLQSALWCTLQADLLYLLWALMGSKTKAETQRRLLELGFLSVLQDMFERLDWRPPAMHLAHLAAGSAASCSCSPQSCLQMQLLRTLQVLCEKDAGQRSHHRLLLEPQRHCASAPAAAAAAAGVAAAAAAAGRSSSSSSSSGPTAVAAAAERRHPPQAPTPR